MNDKDTITLPRKVGEHLKLVLEECLTHGDLVERDSIEALGTALAAPKQEPLAYFDLQKQVFYWARETIIDVPLTVALEPLPLYAAPSEDIEALRRENARLRANAERGTAALREAFGPELWALGHPAYIITHLREEIAKFDRLWKAATVERDALLAELRREDKT